MPINHPHNVTQAVKLHEHSQQLTASTTLDSPGGSCTDTVNNSSGKAHGGSRYAKTMLQELTARRTSPFGIHQCHGQILTKTGKAHPGVQRTA